MKILALDPSGNFKEGKGITGVAIFLNKELVKKKTIEAKAFSSVEEYWKEHLVQIAVVEPDVVIIESFKLFADKGKVMTGSEFETAQLIGALKMSCWLKGIPYRMQDPTKKSRYPDELLIKEGYFTKETQPIIHIRDAIRHGVYYINFKLEKESFYESTN